MTLKAVSAFDRDELLARHGITPKDFESTGLEWRLLEEICIHHQGASADLQSAGDYVLQRLQQVPGVHSLKVRVKQPTHLVAKIIRKQLERPELDFSVRSYQDHITDLIGLRALHLFKDEWRSIYDFVLATWDLHENPIAYIRTGDPEALMKDFEDAKLSVIAHPFGYRSVHLLLKFQPDKRTYLAELQVRTIFEEGWSEIDHRVRYPRQSDDAYLANCLAIFNRLSGSADEMGTFIRILSRLPGEHAGKIAERDQQIAEKETELKKTISKLKISESEKETLEEQIEALRRSSLSTENFQIIATGAIGMGLTQPDILSGLDFGGTSRILSLLPYEDQTCITCGEKYANATDTAFLTISGQCAHCRNKGFRFTK